MGNAAPRRLFVSLIVDTDEAPAHPGDSILAGGKLAGTVTSAGWGHRTGKNIAMGFVDPDHAEIGTALHVEIIGKRFPAEVCPPCLYDPDNALVKS